MKKLLFSNVFLDRFGRVTIPVEIRNDLEIKAGDLLEMYINEEDNIIIKTSDVAGFGFKRKIDNNGRLTLSSNMKKRIGIDNNSFDLYFDEIEKQIIIKKYIKEIKEVKITQYCKAVIKNAVFRTGITPEERDFVMSFIDKNSDCEV